MTYQWIFEYPIPVSALLSGLISGIVVFQSFVIAPTVFNVLSETEARAFLRSIFPKFFLWIGLFSLTSLCFSLITNLGGWITALGGILFGRSDHILFTNTDPKPFPGHCRNYKV